MAAQFIRNHPDIQYVANCDAYATRLEQGTEQLSGLQKDVKIEGYEDYRRVLDRKDVDVVHIASPDHWHCQMLIDAMAAGKDVYLEKPLSNTVERAVEALSAYKSSNRVVQFGTQQRSGSHFQEAAKIVQEGQLGKITHAVIQFPGNGYGTAPEAEAPVPQGLNWDLFQGPAPRRPFKPGRLRWRGWWDALPPGLAARATFDELREDVTPEPGETWGSKVSRSSHAIRNAFVRRSEHDRETK